ncbi:ribosome maturation factor RimP [Trueperella bialowiezensis]|uniref:Ribosome maturation factor RimP n=1 Tax=Trueperella bialowiezensis TaxID=312285 RepID=A0A3S4X4R6_9ACTO|nr:ribosome maturation factor RimP [Trueperella bialowiezensis]VEI12663.1 Ribosome maturation factor RimP [Trueperella bialowiezensis]
MSTHSEIASLVEPIVNEHGLYLEQVELHRAGKHSTLRVTIDLPDGPGGVDSGALSEVTRAVSAALDEADPIAGSYNLEVTTPGAERKLTTARHFSRAQGRLVAFSLDDGTEFEGRINAVSGDTVVVAVGSEERSLDLADIAGAQVRLEF